MLRFWRKLKHQLSTFKLGGARARRRAFKRLRTEPHAPQQISPDGVAVSGDCIASVCLYITHLILAFIPILIKFLA